MTDARIDIISQTCLAQGWGRLTATRLRLVLADGSATDMLREVYDHGHGAAVLPYCIETGCVMLVRQFRYPVHLSGDPAWLLEAPAGLLDADDAEAAARREAEEETGLRLGRLEPVATIYMSPGSLNEKVHCFLAAYGETDRVGPGGGLAEESEAIEVVETPFAEALAGCTDGRVVDAKTIVLLQHLGLSGRMAGVQR